MKVLGLIPARAGSKRLPSKNTADLGGAPLWEHTLTQAWASHALSTVAISTNMPEIINAPYMRDTIILIRPENLAGDDVPMMPVVMHALEELKGCGSFDAVCILQPTSPFRKGSDIAACVKAMEDTGADSVVSVTEGPNDLAFMVRHANRLERLPPVVVPNGAIFLIKTSALASGIDWYGPHAYAYVMPREDSLDINIALDLAVARFIFAQRQQ